MPKVVKEDPSGVFKHPFFCKIEKNEGRPFGGIEKICGKKVSQNRKNQHKKDFGQGRDSIPRPPAWQTSKKK